MSPIGRAATMNAISSWPKSHPKAMCSWTGRAAEPLWSSTGSDPSTLNQGEAKCETGRLSFLDRSNVHPYLAQSLTLLMSRHRSEHTNRPGGSHPQSLLGPPKKERTDERRRKDEATLDRFCDVDINGSACLGSKSDSSKERPKPNRASPYGAESSDGDRSRRTRDGCGCREPNVQSRVA